MGNLDYDPIKFLRTHSKNADSADLQTQVWGCAFEPEDGKCFFPGALTVATCGGNSVCFMDCVTGTVIAKYYTKNPRISLFSLAWTSLLHFSDRRNILAVGGSESSLFFFDSSQKLCVLKEEFRPKKTIINALFFHPSEKGILFCGSNDGMVRVCELKKDIYMHSPRYTFQMNCLFCTNSEVYDIAFCLHTKYLLSSCDDGINCFAFRSKASLRSSDDKEGTKCWVKLMLSGHVFTNRLCKNTLVDSVQVLKDGLAACKYALHGCIYIFNLCKLADAHSNNPDLLSLELEPLYVLAWSKTDNYFMYMDVSPDCGLLCCGDDEGALWLYDLNLLLSTRNSGDWLCMKPQTLPSAILPWPHVTDHYNDKKRKLSLEKYDIVMDRVAIHSSGQFLIAVTNNNLVCLWRKVGSAHSSEGQ